MFNDPKELVNFKSPISKRSPLINIVRDLKYMGIIASNVFYEPM